MMRVVACVWLVLLVGAVAFVGRYGPRTPYMDQWGLIVPVLTGEQPETLTWLWTPHNEHRLPLPKLVETALVRATDGDFRAGMMFNVAVLGALALAIPVTLARRRGHAVATDAIFPLLFLGWGQCETLLRGDAAGNALTTALACTLIAVTASTRGRPTPGAALIAGAALVLLPLCGPAGLPFVPPLALWLILISRGTRARSAALGLAGVGLLLTGAYIVGFVRPAYHPAPAGLWASLRTTAEFLAMAFGPAVLQDWTLPALVIGAMLILDAALLARRGFQSAAERPRALGLGAVLLALLLLALEVGIARSGFGPRAGLAVRYAILGCPLIAHAYVVWDLYAPRPLLRGGRRVMLGLVLVLAPANVRSGLECGRDRRLGADAFERDLRAGLPAATIARLHAPTIYPDPLGFTLRLEALRMARATGFENVSAPGSAWSGLRAEPVALEHGLAHEATWSNGLARATGADPFVVFRLGPPRFVYAIRVGYAYPEAAADGAAELELFWRQAGVNDFTPGVRNARESVPPGPDGGVVTIEVLDTVDELRLDADPQGGALRVSEITLFLAR